MKFKELNIDSGVLKALCENGLVVLTEIQMLAIPAALEGRDIIGSSQTGTGKTLAFVIPLLQKLISLKWTPDDGIGGLILVPTRELALQIFGVLCHVGKYTGFHVGLVIGGLDTENEMLGASGMTIAVCTPGRLLQHLQEGSWFDIGNVQVLVLDEADKMVEMGFKEDIESVLEYIPVNRQVILFSATLKVSIVRVLKLADPEIISVSSGEGFPSKLYQYFHMVNVEEKINMLYTFIGRNRDVKGVVFFSTCKQVKFHYLLFEKFKLSAKIFCLSGGMSQKQRIEMFGNFVKRRSGFLFCTDLGSRGLDFPRVDVVVQYDCPCNVETYVHRVGRTARNDEEGRSYIYLVYGEEKLLHDVQKKEWIVDTSKKSSDRRPISIPDRVVEGPRNKVKNVDKRVKTLIKLNDELREYCKKYLQTYEKFLMFSSRRYSNDTVKKLEKLYEHFGVTPEERVLHSIPVNHHESA